MDDSPVESVMWKAFSSAALILKFRSRAELPRSARRAYCSRIVRTAKFFNEGIEKIVYEPVVRNRIGLPLSGTVYTSPAWSMNVVYARIQAEGLLSTSF